MKSLTFSFFLFLTALNLFAQPVRVSGITVNSSKTTQENSVLRYLSIVTSFSPGNAYLNEGDFYSDLDEAIHQLNNTLYFRDVRYDVRFESVSDGTREAFVNIRLEDAWTLYPLPVLKYDSNYGLIYGGLIRSHNTMGTLTDLTVGIRYNPEIWYAWLEWEYLRIGNTLWDIWIFEQFETIRRIDESNTTIVDFDYYSTELKTRTNIPVYNRLYYTLSPGIYFPYSYNIRRKGSDEVIDDTGITPSFEHQLSWNGVNWLGTHRSGLYGGLNHTIDYNIPRERLQNIITLETQYFYNKNKFDAHARGLFIHSWGDKVELMAEYVRGLRDARLWGTTALIFNFSAGMTVLDIKNVGEMQLMPFCDIAFVNDREPVCTFGIQILAFLDFFPALPNTVYWGADVLHENETEFKMYSGLHTEKQRFR